MTVLVAIFAAAMALWVDGNLAAWGEKPEPFEPHRDGLEVKGFSPRLRPGSNSVSARPFSAKVTYDFIRQESPAIPLFAATALPRTTLREEGATDYVVGAGIGRQHSRDDCPAVLASVPRLVLAAVPSPAPALSVREAAKRKAHQNQLAVRAALDRFGFPDPTAKREPMLKLAFHCTVDPSTASDRDTATEALQRSSRVTSAEKHRTPDKEPSNQEVADKVGARLDPLHPEMNPNKYKTESLSDAIKPAAVPKELQDLSLMAKAIADAKMLRDAASQSTDVGGLVGVRRAGYNPMLRKYEQRMPKPVAEYLARGRQGVNHYPDDRPSVQKAKLEWLSKVQTKDTKDNDKDEASRPPLPYKVQVSIDRLSTPRQRNPGIALSAMEWTLAPHLLPKRKERDFQKENAMDLHRWRPERRASELKEKGLRHVERVHLAHDSAQQRKREMKERVLEKERERLWRLDEKKRQHEMMLEQQGKQQTWFKLLFVLRTAQVLLHAATVATENEANKAMLELTSSDNAAQCTRYLQKKAWLSRLATHVRVVRQRRETRVHEQAQRNNSLAMVRWVFDNRKLLGNPPKKLPAVQRLLLRVHYKKQIKYIEDAAVVVKGILEAVGKVRHTMFKIREYKNSVIKCQRLVRNSLRRRDEHLFFILAHVKESTKVIILQEIIRGVTSLFPACSHFSSKSEMSISRHTDIKVSLMRHEQIKHYERVFPGLPLWIAISLEKLSGDLIKAYALEYHVNLQPSKVWELFEMVFRQGLVHDDDCRVLTWEIYNDLHEHVLKSWEGHFRQRELWEARKDQEEYIRDALATYSTTATKLWVQSKYQGTNRPPAPEWPMHLVSDTKVFQMFQEIVAKSMQEDKRLQDAVRKKAPSKDVARVKSTREQEQEALRVKLEAEQNRAEELEAQRAKVLARISRRNAMAMADKGLHVGKACSVTVRPNQEDHRPPSEPLLCDSNDDGGDEQDYMARRLKLHKQTLSRQLKFFEVRKNTQQAFKGLLQDLPCNTGIPCCPRAYDRGHHEKTICHPDFKPQRSEPQKQAGS